MVTVAYKRFHCIWLLREQNLKQVSKVNTILNVIDHITWTTEMFTLKLVSNSHILFWFISKQSTSQRKKSLATYSKQYIVSKQRPEIHEFKVALHSKTFSNMYNYKGHVKLHMILLFSLSTCSHVEVFLSFIFTWDKLVYLQSVSGSLI